MMGLFDKIMRNKLYKTDIFHVNLLPKRQASIKIQQDKYEELRSGRSNPKAQRLYVWGLADLGALGEVKIRSQRNKIQFAHRPVRKIFAFTHKIIDFSCGYGFTLYAAKDESNKKLFGSGLNTDFQIGYHEVRRGHPLKTLYSIQSIKLPLKSPKRTNVIKVATGRAHSVVLTDNEGVFTFGNNAFGQCGRTIVENEDYAVFREAHRITELDGKAVKSVVCGQDHSLFLTEAGLVYSCGCGSDGQTGLGQLKTTSTPTLVQGDILGETIVKFSSTADTVLALNNKGEVFGWGNNEYFQIPNNTEAQQISTPIHIKKLSKLGKIKDIASGSTSSMVLTEENEVFVWGYGILGKGPAYLQSPAPLNLPATLFGYNQFSPDTKVESICCGINSSAAITNKGDLYMWGKNEFGQLGIGNQNDQYFPFRVGVGAKVVKISCGADHTMALCKPYF